MFESCVGAIVSATRQKSGRPVIGAPVGGTKVPPATVCAAAAASAYVVSGRDIRLGQVFNNLLDNARSFCRKDGTVKVTARRTGEWIEVTIDDDGPGIRDDQFERIFERFGRAVSSRSYGGLGLGLYLARRAAEAHGGRAWAEMREGGGARFTLELPLEKEERA